MFKIRWIRYQKKTKPKDDMNTDKNDPEDSLAEVLVRKEVITPADLEKAKLESKARNIPLRETLIGLDMCLEDQINWAISSDLNIPYILLTNEMLDLEIARNFELNFLRRIKAIPIPNALGGITLVMADPLNTEAFVQANDAIKVDLQLAIGSVGRISTALDFLTQEQQGEMETSAVTLTAVRDSGGVASVYRMLIDARKRFASRILLRPSGDGLEAVFHLERGWVVYRTWSRQEALSVITRCRLLAGLKPKSKEVKETATFKSRIGDEKLKFNFEFTHDAAGDTLSIDIFRITTCQEYTRMESLLEPHREALERLFSARRPTGVILCNASDERQRFRMIYGLLTRLASLKLDVITLEKTSFMECPGIRRIEYSKKSEVDLAEITQKADVISIPTIHLSQISDIFHMAGDSIILAGVDFVNTLLILHAVFEEITPRVMVADRLRLIWSGRRVDLTCQMCGGKVDVNRGLSIDQLCPECDGYGRTKGTDLFEVLAPDSKFRQIISTEKFWDLLSAESRRLTVQPSIDRQLSDGLGSGRIFNKVPESEKG